MSKNEKIKFQPDLFFPDGDLQYLYDSLNYKYFRLKLPTVQVGYYYGSHERKNYGSTIRLNKASYPNYICLNPLFRDWIKTNEATLLHEMCHVKLHTLCAQTGKRPGASHGPQFKAELRRLILAGAFDELL